MNKSRVNKTITTCIQINTGADKVWGVLTDFASYPLWNPFIVHISGELEVGKVLRTTIARTGGGRITFKPTVVSCEPGCLLRWCGHLVGMPWLFTGLHSFEISTLPDGMTEVIHSEKFSGLLSGPLFSSIHKETEQGFLSMNEAMKKRLTQ